MVPNGGQRTQSAQIQQEYVAIKASIQKWNWNAALEFNPDSFEVSAWVIEHSESGWCTETTQVSYKKGKYRVRQIA